MLLVVDIGNTQATFGVYEGNYLLKRFYIESQKDIINAFAEEIFKTVLEDFKIKSCVIASVVEGLDEFVKQICDRYFKINSLIIKHNNIGNFICEVDEPEKVGIDRIINSYMVKQKYPCPALIVDLGSAITFDVVSKEGNFMGGAIMPGVGLQFRSLHDYTSKLPLIKPEKVKHFIGKNTKDAILAGVIWGVVSAVYGIVEQMEEEYGEKFTLIATGGYSELISQYAIRKFDYVDQQLTLDGMKDLYERVIF